MYLEKQEWKSLKPVLAHPLPSDFPPKAVGKSLSSAQCKGCLSFLMTFTMQLDLLWQISQSTGRADFFWLVEVICFESGLMELALYISIESMDFHNMYFMELLRNKERRKRI